ncbi:ependymin-like isoform X1 [Heterodontus francisci]|uniref:ependymin-like isoform X1 n=2 Tax=Heterodontus francisci TaxID=7792 RepID=UPI00355B7F30
MFASLRKYKVTVQFEPDLQWHDSIGVVLIADTQRNTMKLLAALFICSLFFLVTEGDKPAPCSSPMLLEGQIILFDQSKFYEEWAKFSYDSIQERMSAFKVVFLGPDKNLQVREILLFQESIQYIFYPQNKTCVKYPLRTPFQRIEIPRNATFTAQMYIGGSSSPKEGVLANVWNGDIDAGHYFLTFTEYGCLPVSEVFYSKTGWISISFLNLTKGISDPTVFTPPPECSHLN